MRWQHFIFIVLLPALICSTIVSGNVVADENNDNMHCGISPYVPPFASSKYANRANRFMIINGHVVSDASSLPWMAALYIPWFKHSHILTAAHCFAFYFYMNDFPDYDWPEVNTTYFHVVVGATNYSDPAGIQVRSKRVMPHPHAGFIDHEHAVASIENDLAIVELEEPLNYTKTVQPICLGAYQYDEHKQRDAIIAGWGITNFSDYHINTILHDGRSQIVDPKNCSKLYKWFYPEKQLCVDGFANLPCLDDSGGPLLLKTDATHWVQVGVDSYSLGKYSYVYTGFSHYCKWIEEKTENEVKCVENKNQKLTP